MGAALISMVANFTVGKKGYEDVDVEAQGILEKSEDFDAVLKSIGSSFEEIDPTKNSIRDIIKEL